MDKNDPKSKSEDTSSTESQEKRASLSVSELQRMSREMSKELYRLRKEDPIIPK